MGIVTTIHDGFGEVIVDQPPVNALPIQGWFDLAEAIGELGMNTDVHAVVLAADGRGFNAGVDIKELQAHQGHQALLDVNRGCAAAFSAVYDCPVPVIAAVHGYCLGGGIGLVGNADLIIASECATFALPEVDRGALGAATHLSRLVPQHKLRAMVYTCAPATAHELHAWGSVHAVVPRDQLRTASHRLAAQLTSKDPRVLRAAKASLNGIDPMDPHKSYRFEQGFTFELTLSGAGDEARDRFIKGPKE